MRALLLLISLALLAACGAGRTPAATPPPAPTTPAVAELLSAGAPGPISTIGYLYIGPDGAILADSLSRGAGGLPAPTDGLAIWLEGVPPLPPEVQATPVGDAGYALVQARGQLEGPGRFGPDGGYSFRMVAPALEPLSVRELSMPLLLQNSALYEGQAVHLSGQLLADRDSALLVEQLGAGGVPADSALQLKLAIPPRDPALVQALRQAGSGDVRFGPVAITGLWRGGRLYPLLVTTP